MCVILKRERALKLSSKRHLIPILIFSHINGKLRENRLELTERTKNKLSNLAAVSNNNIESGAVLPPLRGILC
jgi:hypothetical protein